MKRACKNITHKKMINSEQHVLPLKIKFKHMKKIFLILFILILSNTIKAQTEVPIENWAYHMKENNVYFKDVNGLFNKFLGTWEYNDGIHYFKITLVKRTKKALGIDSIGERYLKSIKFSDYIDCYYIYKQNGITIYNFYPANGLLTDYSGSGINAHTYVVDTQNNLYLDYDEPVSNTCSYRQKSGRLKVTFINSQLPQLLWTRTDRNKSYPLSFGCADTSDFKIPAVMTLTKIN